MSKHLGRFPTRDRILSKVVADLLSHVETKLGFPLEPPYPIRTIANLVGLKIEQSALSDFSDRVAAVLDIASSTIYYRSTASAVQTRFAIAHEIGHWILHREVFLNRHQLKAVESERLEHEAGFFATELLIPEKDVHAFLGPTVNVDSKIFSRLQSRFNVSRTALLQRLEYLSRSSHNIQLGTVTWPNHPYGGKRRSILATDLTHMAVKYWTARYRVPNFFISRNPAKKTITPAFAVPTDERDQSIYKDLHKPVVIEFDGPPNTAKDTSIWDLAYVLTHKYNLTVKIVDEGLIERPYPKGDLKLRFIQSVFSTALGILEATHRAAAYDVVLVNRGFFDIVAWIEYYHRIEILSESEASNLRNVISEDYLKGVVDLAIVLMVEPTLSIEREEKEIADLNKRIGKEKNELNGRGHSIVNPTSLAILSSAYRKSVVESNWDLPLYLCDTNGLSLEKTVGNLIEKCEELVVEGKIQLRMPV